MRGGDVWNYGLKENYFQSILSNNCNIQLYMKLLNNDNYYLTTLAESFEGIICQLATKLLILYLLIELGDIFTKELSKQKVGYIPPLFTSTVSVPSKLF